ncbi:molybdate ABC transporter substrate-binding protein [Fuchsiella alkaliacetigena]|uniref:molybdate ABC transporter substrate-binding protein n=1 Tax=Fuchsiella alkaliacetigena TaxID=957042 RepID=UPI00200A0C70|nr:molybdate ABC transporter substrate-binding protein [Fuchsiella alkaliacetigena]MCK8824792.1 molybdate ABC transporter substrate-binding protein [Fuchsiella alkaliacetigena]
MNKKRAIQSLIVILILVLISLSSACDLVNNQGNKSAAEKELHVAAASDLRFAFEELGELFEKERGVEVVFQFGSSGNLAQQIANGAPIDLFASANKEFVDRLIESDDIIEETKSLYAIGRIVLAVNKNYDLNLESLEGLLSPEIKRIAIANPSHAPYGLAAKEALVSKGLWKQLEESLVYGENINQAMQFVRTANAPVGIIALSIAEMDELEYTLIDEKYHNPLEQMLGVVKHSEQQELAQEFADFINSTQGREVMEEYGFYLP